MVNTKNIAPIDICLFRMVINFTIPLIILRAKNIPIHLPVKDRLFTFLMGWTTLTTFAAITFVLPHIKIAVFTAIFATAIFWSALMGWKFNNDQLTLIEIICMFVCFGGVLLICLTGQEEDITSIEQNDGTEITPAELNEEKYSMSIFASATLTLLGAFS